MIWIYLLVVVWMIKDHSSLLHHDLRSYSTPGWISKQICLGIGVFNLTWYPFQTILFGNMDGGWWGYGIRKGESGIKLVCFIETDDKNRNDELKLTEENETYNQPIGLVDEGISTPSNYRKLGTNSITLPSTKRYDQGINISAIDDPHLFLTTVILPNDGDNERKDVRLKTGHDF